MRVVTTDRPDHTAGHAECVAQAHVWDDQPIEGRPRKLLEVRHFHGPSAFAQAHSWAVAFEDRERSSERKTVVFQAPNNNWYRIVSMPTHTRAAVGQAYGFRTLPLITQIQPPKGGHHVKA